MKVDLKQLRVIVYQSSLLDTPVIHDDAAYTEEVEAHMECQRLNEELGVRKRYTYMTLERYLRQPPITDEEDVVACPACVGSRVLGEIRGVQCVNCGGHGTVPA